jgi:hypothetical protein
MLARPEIGTKQHVILWLASKPVDETYDWCKGSECACGQYWGEHVNKKFPHMWRESPTMSWLNMLALDCKTFGELYQKARASCASS